YIDESCAIYLNNASATVEGNIIDGGSGKRTTGIYCFGTCCPLITANTIEGGKGQKVGIPDVDDFCGAYGIRIQTAAPKIEENRISNRYMAIDWYGIYEEDESSDPSSVLRNIFMSNGLGYLYYDEWSTAILSLTTAITNSGNETLSAWGNSLQ
ncbi:MAG TPA: right-handed parallel beta-helix repeat-containing protein, partial [Spirochaetota bacterium]|nr:right-handed parallel beta-helix repeat-containing protein [Spirochaetota bacterium]